MDAGYCDVAVIATEKGKLRIKALTGSPIGREDLLENMICHLLPDSKNIFKKRVHTKTEIKLMARVRNTVHELITQLSSQTSVEFDLEMGDGSKIHKVVKREEFDEVNKEVFEKGD
ncbi:putative Heat shock protein 70 family [Medicago truncatula]|uniref:Putative Heat shock protein 70 family n=1 Tax=Medicago truncatula TaxID=3880 RepID=A0A396IF05_MEDTR|nr:putative Heat shock protein 70 family [Medicago truncatula]